MVDSVQDTKPLHTKCAPMLDGEGTRSAIVHLCASLALARALSRLLDALEAKLAT